MPDNRVKDTRVKDTSPDTPSLSISAEKIYWISTNARRFDVKDVVTEPDPGSNPSDDGMREVLEDHSDDPVLAELVADIRALNEDEQIDLVALAWLGRGDGDLKDWDNLRSEAARAHNNRTASYLLSLPLLSDYLDEALAQFGHSAEEFERPQ
jgi:Protein of unknown function (DUF3775)